MHLYHPTACSIWTAELALFRLRFRLLKRVVWYEIGVIAGSRLYALRMYAAVQLFPMSIVTGMCPHLDQQHVLFGLKAWFLCTYAGATARHLDRHLNVQLFPISIAT